ncbi:MAG TPA: DUF418 domain-containing protein [Polyangiaceae bacterium]|nr:DUF418 domain-containing protein [Polyangiaceae bacterium]
MSQAPEAPPVDPPRPDAPPVDAPRPAAAPVAQAERIAIIDAVRGVALLGILLMNIPIFALPERFDEPWRADTGSADFWVHAFNIVFFEGKMRALFSAVFGAGIVLFTLGKERAGRPATGLFYRRMLWLTLFGLAHAHLLLWLGDVLYFYGVIGMLAFLLRRVPPRRLALGVPLVAVVGFAASVLFYQNMRAKRLAWREAVTAQAEGRALGPAQTEALAAWREVEKNFIPNREEIAQHTALMKGTYGQVASFVRPKAAEGEFKYLLLGLWDMLALMLLGIALYRWGFFTLQWSDRAYKRTALIGYALGLPAVVFSHVYIVLTFPTLDAMLAGLERIPVPWTGALYDLQRIALMMAHVSVLMLAYRAGWLPGLFARLRAVGQMAFTNYILQTVICSLVFFGYGLNQFAAWRYHQLYALVAAVWVLQLALSPLWLRAFHFGPLEWLWRTLTYWKPQPFVRREPAAAAAA